MAKAVELQSKAEGDPSDALPGMYSLAQQWVAEVAAERFPELQRGGVDFDTWFSNPRVSLYLQVLHPLPTHRIPCQPCTCRM